MTFFGMGCGASKKISEQERIDRWVKYDVMYLVQAHRNNNRECRTSLTLKDDNGYPIYLSKVKAKLLEKNISVTQTTRYGYVDTCCHFYSVITTTFYFSNNGS